MSKIDYKKEIMDSLKEGSIVTRVTFSLYVILKYLFKASPPSAKLDLTDVGKLGVKIMSRVFVRDYTIEKKWINL